MHHPAFGSQCRVPRLLRVPVRLNICNYNSPLGRLEARIRFTLANNCHPSLSSPGPTGWGTPARRNFAHSGNNWTSLMHKIENKTDGFLLAFDRNRLFFPKHATISVLNSRWPLILGQPNPPNFSGSTWHYGWPLPTSRTSSQKPYWKFHLSSLGRQGARSWFSDL